MTGCPQLERLREAGFLADIDRHFGLLLHEFGASPEAALTAAVASARHRAGHACLPLDGCAARSVAEIADWVADADVRAEAAGDGAPDTAGAIRMPTLERLLADLGASPVVDAPPRAPVPGDPERRPLVLDGNRLYLRRVFEAERLVAARLNAATGVSAPPPASMPSALDELFDVGDAEKRAAAEAVVRGRLCIVTGGPGTGKTTLAAHLIALLVKLELAAPRRVALATPTGKAAARLQESVRSQLPALQARVPALADFRPEAVTLHRLLGGSRLRRLDLLVVDECSMVDLALMARLLAALPDTVRLVLLGDAAQLASVAPGSVFSDLCEAGAAPGSTFAGSVVRLTTNYRFRADGGIGRLAGAVVSGRDAEAMAALDDPADQAVRRTALANETAFEELARRYARDDCARMIAAAAAGEPAFPRRRVLCAHRGGAFGTGRFNRRVEAVLRDEGRIPSDEEFYVGRPVIVTRNDPDTGLSNGDTGIVIDTGEDVRAVWFPELSGDEPYLVSPARLPEHESFFALTVHRSQGSEYEEVAFVPGPADSRVNTRELLYTAVTRARDGVVIHGEEDDVRQGVARRTRRDSGMPERLARAG